MSLEQLTGPGAPFEIGEAEVGGVAMRVWLRSPASLRAVLERTAGKSDQDYLVYNEERLTYGAHLEIVTAVAWWLRDVAGIEKGHRVAIGMRNFPEWVITFWATQAIGAVAVPLNAWWSAAELRFAIEDSGASLVVVDGERHQRLADDIEELGLPHVVARSDVPLGPAAIPWSEVQASTHAHDGLPPVEIGPEDVATILYTSGTTGVPKGAVSTHRNHVSTIHNTAYTGALERVLAGSAAASPTVADPPAALLTYPFFHIGGLNALYINTAFGVKSVLQYKWDLEEALAIIERERITRLAAVPTLLRQLLESPLLEHYDTSSLASLASGGAPVPPDLVGRIDTKGKSPSNGYGLTETTGAVTLNMGRQYLGRSSSVGTPFPVTDVRVVDPDTGADSATGEVGELWFRGPTVSQGYWKRPDATSEAFTDGWFHSGDLGHVDGDGFVSIVDRLKDVIIRGGENVYCAEIEAVLFEHPAIADVAIVGVPDPQLGEEVATVVLMHPGTVVTADEIRQHVADRLAYFKVPAHVLFREAELPRNATGKILKRELRDEVRNHLGR